VDNGVVRVRMFGKLRGLCSLAGAATGIEYPVAAGGVPAAEIATALGLPLDQIEGVFRNHFVRPLDEIIGPGDDIAFVPYGTPGPHRFALGLYNAGRDDDPECSE
jgi:hypothetical protein